MTPEVTRDQALAFRVRKQNLGPDPVAKTLEEVAGICGIHAQVASSAELQFWARLSNVTREDVRKALWAKRTLLRIWAMRGTLHLVPARDLDVFTISLLPIDDERYLRRLRRQGISKQITEAVTEAVGGALKGRVLTRKELADAAALRLRKIDPKLEELARPGLDSSWGWIFKPAARRGMLVSADPDGGQATFADPEAWMKVRKKKLTKEQARKELLRRYMKVYSPTNRIEFAFWAGIDNQDSKVIWTSDGAGNCSSQLRRQDRLRLGFRPEGACVARRNGLW
ncbi:MAG: DNA glycosylase AlkZ-like family protein [Acidimicrobiia bacterium]